MSAGNGPSVAALMMLDEWGNPVRRRGGGFAVEDLGLGDVVVTNANVVRTVSEIVLDGWWVDEHGEEWRPEEIVERRTRFGAASAVDGPAFEFGEAPSVAGGVLAGFASGPDEFEELRHAA